MEINHQILLLLAALALSVTSGVQATPPAAPQATPAAEAEAACEPDFGAIIACRMANYIDGKSDEASFAHVAKVGFKHVFMDIIKPKKIESTKALLARHGLEVAVFRADTDLSRESSVDELTTQIETAEKMGVRYLFLSPKHKTVSKEVAIERLKQVGPIAAKHGIIIGLETHPDLGTNGDEHVKTMKAIDHPNIRVNFDSANITYYNKNTNAVKELSKCIDYVGTFEVKEHDAKFESWYFPALGKGKVDIRTLLGILKAHNYRGPITLEIEGIKALPSTKEERKKEIETSRAYISEMLEAM